MLPSHWKGIPPRHAGAELEAWKGAGARLKELRTTAGLTMEELSDLSGVNKSMISQYERGDRPVTVNAALCLGPALGTTARSLLFGDLK